MSGGIAATLRGDGRVGRTMRKARRGVEKARAITFKGSIPSAMEAIVAEVPLHAIRTHPGAPSDGPIVIAAFSTYPIHTRRGGGQLRAWYLAESLARLGDGSSRPVEVEILSLTTDPTVAGVHHLSDGVTERCLPLDPAHSERETRLRLLADNVAITDVAAGLMWNGIAGFTEAAIDLLEKASIAVAVQPYLIDAILTLARGLPVVYDSHNDEVALKAKLYPPTHAGARWLLDRVADLERRATESASLVTAVTDDDLVGLARRYRIAAPTRVIGNGVDTEEVEFVTGTERTTRRQMLDPRVGLRGDRPTALFVGSGHLPNIEAGRAIVALAREVPEVDFLLAGDHSTHLGVAHLPPNVRALGRVPEDVLELLLTSATIALNPMDSGSGSNLKLFTYLAAGLPVVSTEVGARGLDVDASGIVAVPLEKFPGAIRRLIDPTAGEDHAHAGRSWVEEHCDWRVLGERFARAVVDLAEGRAPTTHESVIPAVAARRTVFVEVSNTLAVNYMTGFQRLTRELLGRLMQADGPVRWVPVVWCTECASFRHLNERELEALAHFVPRSEPQRSRLAQLADPLPPIARDLARRAVRTPAAHALREELAHRRRRRHHPAWHAELRIDSWPDDPWFLDLEAAWHNVPHRSRLLPWLHERGVRTAVLVADVIPYLFPEWFDEDQIRIFTTFMDAHLRHSEKFVAISECSRRDLMRVARDEGIGRDLDCPIITMGANFRRAADNLERPDEAPPGRYMLSVATVEPRKNHDLLIRAYEALRDEIPDLSVVFVGKPGWMTEDLQERMRNHPDANGRFRWLDKVDDSLLDALFRHAYLAVQPAFYEGYGTPVIEALGNGVPTLSSNGGSLPEAGGEWADYFDPHDLEGLVELIRRMYLDTDLYAARKAALSTYRPPTWEDGADGLATAFAL